MQTWGLQGPVQHSSAACLNQGSSAEAIHRLVWIEHIYLRRCVEIPDLLLWTPMIRADAIDCSDANNSNNNNNNNNNNIIISA